MPMVRSLYFILLACTACCPTHPEEASPAPQKLKLEGWKDVAGGRMGPDGLFYSETGRFFAAFPGMPEHHSKDMENPSGKVRMESYVYQESATLAYMVAYTDYPVKQVDAVGWEEFLATAQAGALRSIGITGNVKSTAVMVNGFHGTRFRSNSDGQFIVSQFLLVGNRLFQCTILSEGSYPVDAVVDQFINGFHMVMASTEVEENWWPAEMDSIERAAKQK